MRARGWVLFYCLGAEQFSRREFFKEISLAQFALIRPAAPLLGRYSDGVRFLDRFLRDLLYYSLKSCASSLY